MRKLAGLVVLLVSKEVVVEACKQKFETCRGHQDIAIPVPHLIVIVELGGALIELFVGDVHKGVQEATFQRSHELGLRVFLSSHYNCLKQV